MSWALFSTKWNVWIWVFLNLTVPERFSYCYRGIKTNNGFYFQDSLWQQMKKQCKELHTKLSYIKGLIAAYDKRVTNTWLSVDWYVNTEQAFRAAFLLGPETTTTTANVRGATTSPKMSGTERPLCPWAVTSSEDLTAGQKECMLWLGTQNQRYRIWCVCARALEEKQPITGHEFKEISFKWKFSSNDPWLWGINNKCSINLI